MNEEFLLIVENLEKYKDLLESKNDEVCDGMTDSEKKAYQLGITNMYEMLRQMVEHDRNEGNYNVFVPEIKEEESGEYDLEDFVKWDSEQRGYSKVKVISDDAYECLNLMTNDLLKAEEYINTLGVQTRNPENDDEFRTMYDVLKDIVTVWNNNPTIGKDVEEFLAGNPTTSDETEEFLGHYNLDGITRNK